MYTDVLNKSPPSREDFLYDDLFFKGLTLFHCFLRKKKKMKDGFQHFFLHITKCLTHICISSFFIVL